MNKTIYLLIIPFVFMASCSKNKYGETMAEQYSDWLAPIGGAAVGAAVAGDDDTDKLIGAAAGAGVGMLANKFIMGDEKQEKAFQAGIKEGYKKGEADAVKRQYWSLQKNTGSGADGTAGGLTFREYDIPATITGDGTTYLPRKIKVPVVEP